MKTFVLLTTDVLSVIYYKNHPSGSPADSLTIAQAVQHALAQGTNRANSRNDWSDWFTEAFHPAMGQAGFKLAQDIEAGHTWLIDINSRQVATAYSFCAQATDPNHAHVMDLGHSGKLNDFLVAWKQDMEDTDNKAAVPVRFINSAKGTAEDPGNRAERELVEKEQLDHLKAQAKAHPAKPAPASKVAKGKPALAGITEATRQYKEATAKLAGNGKRADAISPVGPKLAKLITTTKARAKEIDKEVEAAKAAIVNRPPSDALAKAKAMLRSNLKPATPAAN